MKYFLALAFLLPSAFVLFVPLTRAQNNSDNTFTQTDNTFSQGSNSFSSSQNTLNQSGNSFSSPQNTVGQTSNTGIQTTGVNTSQTQTTGFNTGISNSGTTQGGLFNPLSSGTNLGTFLNDILAFVVKIGTVVVVLMMVIVGFLFATAQGDPSKLTRAREALLWTVVGALIVLGAQAIASGIQATAQALSTGS